MINKKEMLNQQLEEAIEEKLTLDLDNNKMDDHLNHKSEEAKKICMKEQERQRIMELKMTIRLGELDQGRM